jgi:hypothetical protein
VWFARQNPKEFHRGHDGQDLQQNRLGPTQQTCPPRRDATRRSTFDLGHYSGRTPKNLTGDMAGKTSNTPYSPFVRERCLPAIARRATGVPQDAMQPAEVTREVRSTKPRRRG